MLFRTAIILFLLFSPIAVLAQKHGKSPTSPSAAPAPSAPSATSAASPTVSGATNFEQGYHYHMSPGMLMNYSHIDSVKYNITDTVQGPITIETITNTRVVNINPKDPKIGMVKFKPDTTYCQIIPWDNSYITQPCGGKIAYIRTVRTTINIDTIERYSNTTMHISITQEDSGKLALQFAFPNSNTKQQPVGLSGDSGIAVYIKDITFNGYRHIGIPVQDDDLINSFSFYLRKHYSTFQLGVLTIPYKYRFGGRSFTDSTGKTDKVPNDVTQAINLSLAASFRFGGTKFFYDPAKTHNTCAKMITVFLGPSLISPTPSNTIPYVTKSTNELGITTGAGFSVLLKGISLGVFSGIDIPVSQPGKDWFYANRLWLGFGIGVNLTFFTASTAEQPTGNNQ
jgi:hypothetical protein